MPNPQQVFIDPANTLLAQTAVSLQTGTINVPGTPAKGVLTFRSATTTFTAILNAADLKSWSKTIAELADSMSGSGLTIAKSVPISMPAPDGH
jgi:hypothetical protein